MPDEFPPVSNTEQGERILEGSADSMWGNIVLFTGCALVCNGFTLWQYFETRDLPAFSPGKLLALGAFGFYLLVVALVHWLKLLDPRPVLSTRAAAFRVGQPFDLRLRLEGGRRHAREIVVTLEGRESTTYREGTDTVIDAQTFFFETLSISDESDARFDIRVATDRMHSLKTGSNEILWRLKAFVVLGSGQIVTHDWTLWLEPAHSVDVSAKPGIPLEKVEEPDDGGQA